MELGTMKGMVKLISDKYSEHKLVFIPNNLDIVVDLPFFDPPEGEYIAVCTTPLYSRHGIYDILYLLHKGDAHFEIVNYSLITDHLNVENKKGFAAISMVNMTIAACVSAAVYVLSGYFIYTIVGFVLSAYAIHWYSLSKGWQPKGNADFQPSEDEWSDFLGMLRELARKAEGEPQF